MKKVTVLEGQNILDICLQEYGSVEGLVQLAKDNNMRVDADLYTGQVLLIDETKIVDSRIVAHFAKNKIKINTGAYEDVTLENVSRITSDGATRVTSDGETRIIS